MLPLSSEIGPFGWRLVGAALAANRVLTYGGSRLKPLLQLIACEPRLPSAHPARRRSRDHTSARFGLNSAVPADDRSVR